ncbi:MAG: hypothetical protein HXY30_17250 [Pseudorhodoplanes sp.]|nr:hypothetical protein [Pseudorhodoplanes sp.]
MNTINAVNLAMLRDAAIIIACGALTVALIHMVYALGDIARAFQIKLDLLRRE